MNQTPEKQPDKKILGLIIFLSLGFLYADYTYLLKPQLHKVGDLQQQITKLNGDLDVFAQESARAQAMKKDFARGEGAPRIKHLVTEGEILLLIERISSLAKDNRMRVVQIKPVRESQAVGAKKAGVTPFSVELEVASDYYNLTRFIRGVEDDEFFMSVKSMRIVPSTSDQAAQKIQIIIRTFVSL